MDCLSESNAERRLQAVWARKFESELRQARAEHRRLSALYKDVCWYNFEVACREWRVPWHPSCMYSPATLHGYKETKRWRDGRCISEDVFPIWYAGNLRDAPLLPPDIIYKEKEEAADYVQVCIEQCTAASDWAPGGDKYNHMCRYSLGVALYDELQATKSDVSRKANATPRRN